MENPVTPERLVSVIVPVYNSAPYLGYCLNSIICQTYQNLEIIVIDDGSTDDSLTICQNYATIDARIQVISADYHDVSSARNAGLDNAHGDYVAFVDSDDVVCDNLIAHLVQLLETYEADLALCGYHIVTLDSDNKVTHHVTTASDALGEECVLTKTNFFEHLASILLQTSYLQGPMCKLFRRDIIEQYCLRFPPQITLGEDLCFNMDYFNCLSGNVVFSRQCGYYYLHALPDGLSRCYRPDRFESELLLLQRFWQLLTNNLTPSPAEEATFAKYAMIKVMQSLYHLTDARCELNSAAKKAVIAQILNHPFVRQVYAQADTLPAAYAWIHECMEFCDVQKVYEFLFEGRQPNPNHPLAPVRISVHPRPSFINRLLVKVCDVVLSLHNFNALTRFRHSLGTTGIKTTSKKLVTKAASTVSSKLPTP